MLETELKNLIAAINAVTTVLKDLTAPLKVAGPAPTPTPTPAPAPTPAQPHAPVTGWQPDGTLSPAQPQAPTPMNLSQLDTLLMAKAKTHGRDAIMAILIQANIAGGLSKATPDQLLQVQQAAEALQ